MPKSKLNQVELLRIEMGDVDLSGFSMESAGGADLVSRTAAATGWWSFERPLPAVMVRCAQTWPGVVLDIGANTGFYSLLTTAAHPQVEVIAFEPDPRVVARLTRNVAANDRQDVIEIKPLALSNAAGEAALYIPLQAHGLVETSSSLQHDFKTSHSGVERVAISTLDAEVPDTVDVELIKIDVEGHELEVLEGALQTLARCRPLIMIELLDRADYAYFTALKDRLSYRSYALRFDTAIPEDVMAFDAEAWNHAMVPVEKDAEFQQLLEALRVHVVPSVPAK